MIVWVTRDEPPDGPLSTALRGAGLEVVLEPVLTRRVVTDAADELQRLDADDWLVLTSVFAIEAVALDAARVPRVAVVGEASRRAAVDRGFRVELVSPQGTAKSLLAELRAKFDRGRVCYPRSSLTAAPLGWPGVEMLTLVLYETVARAFDRSVADRVDVVTVASPSAVNAIGRVDLSFASIGSTTTAALRAAGTEPWIESPQKSFESLASAIADHASDSRHHRA